MRTFFLRLAVALLFAVPGLLTLLQSEAFADGLCQITCRPPKP